MGVLLEDMIDEVGADGSSTFDCLEFFSELQDMIDKVAADGNSTIDCLKFLSELQDIIDEVGADGEAGVQQRCGFEQRRTPSGRRVCEQLRKKRSKPGPPPGAENRTLFIRLSQCTLGGLPASSRQTSGAFPNGGDRRVPLVFVPGRCCLAGRLW